MRKALDWLDERSGFRDLTKKALEESVPGGASFAYVFGSILSFLLVQQMVTGILLAMYYSPSANSAWASVAYIQDSVAGGWFVRGLHSHGASAMVIVAGLHMFQTAVYGAYKKPRELNWIVGVAMMGIIMAFALTGYLLPWDQTGYWATKVATGIAGTTPVIGAEVQQAVQSGNEYGNLTITRFFAIHVFVLPAIMIGLTVAHVALFRRHGVTPHWFFSKEKLKEKVQMFWPDQMFKDMVAIVFCFGILVVVNIYTHGAHLGAPADPGSNFDARPEWYFRPLFQALKYFHGIWEQIVALGMPAVLGGIFLSVPFLDRGESRNPARRIPYLMPLAVVGLGAVLLTWISFSEDASDADLQSRLENSHERATIARTIAKEKGVPASGPLALFDPPDTPVARGETLWKKDCAGCHEGSDLSGPAIGAGYNSRTWIRAFLKNPSGDRFFGATSISGMEPVELEGSDLDAIVEMVYRETGAEDAKKELADTGAALFEDGDCSGCHPSLGDYGEDASGGPNLTSRGSVKMLAEFIGRPSHPRWFGSDNEMPEFYDKYNLAQRKDIAAYLVWLRSQKAEGSSNAPGAVGE